MASPVKAPEQSSAIAFNTTIPITNSVPAASPVSVPASTIASACSPSKHSDHCSMWHQILGHAQVANQFSASIKIVRSDNGLKFFNAQCATLFTSLGIVHQSSCVHTPQQNGVSERKHRHLLEMARALRFQAHSPLKFWGECVLTTSFIINRLPSSVLSGKSPYELFHGQSPSLTQLKVFGYLCYATTPCFTDKFSSKAIPAIFMASIPSYDDTFPTRDDVPSSSPPTSVLTPKPLIAQPEPSSLQPPLSPVMQPNITPSTPSPIEQQPTHISDVTLRKSVRTSNPPLWLTDYVHQVKPTSTPYSISFSLNYSSLSPSYKACLTSYSSIVEPTTFEQAATDSNWVQDRNLRFRPSLAITPGSW
ncbi:PREDICTED: uncharacterized protein LOC109206059 [Nicotiana attenuata]|uniref:uncharacterized protein LOC109206059 n=1 Tax=Nicotiana attenuata TaxID=49451 RepID=UPI00090460FF|nr:PREDICTED: uncharacterized protein LOC109206059 [Nicotiana attenuata]